VELALRRRKFVALRLLVLRTTLNVGIIIVVKIKEIVFLLPSVIILLILSNVQMAHVYPIDINVRKSSLFLVLLINLLNVQI
jgi:hypothetical protein